MKGSKDDTSVFISKGPPGLCGIACDTVINGGESDTLPETQQSSGFSSLVDP